MFFFGSKADKISCDEVKKMMDEKQSFTLIDVRTPEEFKSIHIKGAKNVPLQAIPQKISSTAAKKEKMLVVYCQSGSRARAAQRTLKNMGYTNVKNLGSIRAWKYEKAK